MRRPAAEDARADIQENLARKSHQASVAIARGYDFGNAIEAVRIELRCGRTRRAEVCNRPELRVVPEWVRDVPLVGVGVPAIHVARRNLDLAIAIDICKHRDAHAPRARQDLARVETAARRPVVDFAGRDHFGNTIVVQIVQGRPIPAVATDVGAKPDPKAGVRFGELVPTVGDHAAQSAMGDDVWEAVTVDVADGRR